VRYRVLFVYSNGDTCILTCAPNEAEIIPKCVAWTFILKYSEMPLQSLINKTCKLTKCLPLSGEKMVCCISHQLSLREAAGIRDMSHSLTQMPIAGTRGFWPHSRPEGLAFSTGLLQSTMCFALEINIIQWKLQEKVKYQQQKKKSLCVSLSPYCVSVRWQEAMKKTQWARAKGRKLKELQNLNGGKGQSFK
jgi:hypothetical protein